MLSEVSLDPSRLLAWIKQAADRQCQQLGLRPLPIRYGPTGPTHGAEFAWRTMEFVIHPGLSAHLGRHPPAARAWYMLALIAHEAHHYRQYMHPRTRPLVIAKDFRIEQEAYLVGNQQADKRLAQLTPREVNPDGQRRHSGLYQAFHGNPPREVKRLQIRLPKRGERLIKIGKLSSLQYEPEPPSQRTGSRFEHEFGDYGYKFRRGQEPLLAVSADGKQLYILAGRYRFSARGIVG